MWSGFPDPLICGVELQIKRDTKPLRKSTDPEIRCTVYILPLNSNKLKGIHNKIKSR